MNSPVILEMCDFAINHMLSCGDSTYISYVLNIFEKSKNFSIILTWFCEMASLTYEVADCTIVLKKIKGKQGVISTLASHLRKPGIGLNFSDIVKPKEDAASLKSSKIRRREIITKKSFDLMDSRLMYDGGYGTGKRR